jgi:hypothetical protein
VPEHSELAHSRVHDAKEVIELDGRVAQGFEGLCRNQADEPG